MKLKFLILFFSVCIWVGNSQNITKQYSNTPLKEVLSDIENSYSVKFSYSDDLISGIEASINFEKASLNEVLQSLNTITGFIFQKVSKRYIVITKKNTSSNASICGFIVDEFTNQPLLGATITISSKMIGVSTNVQGYFQLKAPDKTDSIIVSYIGYKSIKKPIKTLLNKPCEFIQLTERRANLKEILITDYLTGGIDKRTDGSLVISPDKIAILPGLTEPDVLQSIQLLPGIQSPNETASGLHIRGGSPDQNLILFDGVKMYHTAHFFGMLSAFNPYITKSIKVYKSGAGAKYGNHISGVVDIETNTEVPKELTGGFGFNLTHADAFVEVPVSKKIGLFFSARRSVTDLLNTFTFQKLSDRVFQNTLISRDKEISNSELVNTKLDFYFTDFNSKIILKPSKNDKFIINQLYIKNNLNYLYEDDLFKENSTDKLQIRNKGVNSSWERKWNNKTTQKTAIYFSDFDFNYSGIINNEDQPYNNSVKTNEIKDIGFETSISSVLNNSTKLNFGYQFSINKVSYLLQRDDKIFVENSYREEEKNTNKLHAFFGEYVYQNKDILTLHLGLRANHFSFTNSNFLAPRIYGEFKVSPKLRIKSSAEIKQQGISQIIEFSTSDFGLENQIWAISNNFEVPVLKSNQLNIGLIFKNNNWTIDADVYRKNVKGLTSLTKGFNNVDETFSDGESSSEGLEVLIKKQWNKYNSWVSYTTSNTKYLFQELNNNKVFDGNFDIAHSFSWSHNLLIKNFNFSLGWKVRTGIPYTPVSILTEENQLVYSAINSKRLPNYHRLDFSSSYTFNFSKKHKFKGKIGVSLLNIYDKKNIISRSFDIGIDENEVYKLIKKDNYSLGFTPNLVFRLMF